MGRLLLLLLSLFVGVSGVMAAPRATDEILSALQTRLERNIGFEDLIEQLSTLEPRELERLQSDFDKVWPGLRDAYLDDFGSDHDGINLGFRHTPQIKAEFSRKLGSASLNHSQIGKVVYDPAHVGVVEHHFVSSKFPVGFCFVFLHEANCSGPEP